MVMWRHCGTSAGSNEAQCNALNFTQAGKPLFRLEMNEVINARVMERTR